MRNPGFTAQLYYGVGFFAAGVWVLIAWFFLEPWTGLQGNFQASLSEADFNPTPQLTHQMTYAAAVVAHAAVLLFLIRRPVALFHGLLQLWDARSNPIQVLRRRKETFKNIAFFTFMAFGFVAVIAQYSPEAFGYISSSLPEHFTRNVVLSLTVPSMIAWLPIAYLAHKDWILEHPQWRDWTRYGRGGSARWAGPYTFAKLNFDNFIQQAQSGRYQGQMQAPIYFGKTLIEDSYQAGTRHEHIGIDSDIHTLVCAMSGSGKSRDFFGTLHLSYPGGAFIFDPKKEHWQMSKDRRSKFGPVYKLDAWLDDDNTTSFWNVLDEVDLSSGNLRDDLMEITEALVIDEGGGKNSLHFKETTDMFLVGLMAHVKSALPEERRNLATCHDLLIIGDEEGGNADPEVFDRLIVAMEQNPAGGGLAQNAAALMNHAGRQGERGAIITTLLRSIEWCATPNMRRIMSKSSFSMRDIKCRNASVYLVVPFRMIEKHKRWMRLCMNMGLLACQKVPRQWVDESKGIYYRTLFSLDEFGQIGRSKAVQKGLTSLRGSDVILVIAVQELGQLRDNYQDNYDSFMSSTNKLIFGVNDDYTAEKTSKLLGSYTERRDEGKDDMEHQRWLMDPQEVRAFLKQNRKRAVVITANDTAMRLAKIPYYKIFDKGVYGEVRDMPEFIEAGDVQIDNVADLFPDLDNADVIRLDDRRQLQPEEEPTVVAQFPDFVDELVKQEDQRQADALQAAIDRAKADSAKTLNVERSTFEERESIKLAMDEAQARQIFNYDPIQPIAKPELVDRYPRLRENSPEDFRPQIDEAFGVLMEIAA